MACGCGCLGALPACVDPGAQAVMLADQLAAARAGQTLEGMGEGILPTIVWPSDVDAYKRKLEPDFAATDASVARCPSLVDGDRQAWRDFYDAWGKFDAEATPIFGGANKYEEARSYEERLALWQKRLSVTCPLSSPLVTPHTGPDFEVVKWVAGAVVASAIAYSLFKVLG